MFNARSYSAALVLTSAVLLALTAACGDSKPRQTITPPTAVVTAVSTPATAASGRDAPASSPIAGARASATIMAVASPTAARPLTATPAAATPSPVAGLDPCALVTQAEAEAVLGAASAGPTMLRTALLNQCQYAPVAQGADPGDAVTVQLFPGNASLTWPLRRDTFKKTDPTVQPIAGVGDEAFWVGDQRALFVTSQGVIFDVRVPGSGPTALANAKTLALKAVGRLG